MVEKSLIFRFLLWWSSLQRNVYIVMKKFLLLKIFWKLIQGPLSYSAPQSVEHKQGSGRRMFVPWIGTGIEEYSFYSDVIGQKILQSSYFILVFSRIVHRTVCLPEGPPSKLGTVVFVTSYVVISLTYQTRVSFLMCVRRVPILVKVTSWSLDWCLKWQTTCDHRHWGVRSFVCYIYYCRL